MTAQSRIARRLGGAGALAALVIALGACGRVEPPQTGAQAAPAAPTAVVESTPPPALPTVVVSNAPTPQPIPTLPATNNTPVPVPASPNLDPVVSGDTVQIAAEFESSSDLSGWSFAQIYDDPVQAPTWSVEGGNLVAPRNELSGRQFNDVLATTGPAQGPNYTFEATGLSRYNSVIGIVVGYTDPNNYVALLLADSSTPNNKPGLQLVQRVNGETTVLGEQATTLLQTGSWYTFRAEVAGNQITAFLNGKQVFTATANGKLGLNVGTYAGFEGEALFSTARLTVR